MIICICKKIRKQRSNFDFSYFGMKSFAQGVMWIEEKVLGLEIHYLIQEPNEFIGRLLLKEAMKYSNFNNEAFSKQSFIFAKLLKTV